LHFEAIRCRRSQDPLAGCLLVRTRTSVPNRDAETASSGSPAVVPGAAPPIVYSFFHVAGRRNLLFSLMAFLPRALRPFDPVSLAWIPVIIYATSLLGAIVHRKWPVDAAGHPVPVDFLSFWAAGRLALAGHAASAYDWVAHRAVELTGVDFGQYFL